MNIKSLSITSSSPTRIMAIINCSPESFYKKSIVTSKSDIEKKVLKVLEEGADIIDIGAASTAPKKLYSNAYYISEEEEKKRVKKVLPIIRELGDFPISIDTSRASVAEEAIRLGADIINDVSGLKKDENMLRIIKEYKPYLILMATRKEPGDVNTLPELYESLETSISMALDVGLPRKNIIIDPGFGFGKTPEFNMVLLKEITKLKKFKLPILVGISRKSFIRTILESNNDEEILYGSIAATVISVLNGANIIRTHDVKETIPIVKIADYYKENK
ncbi:MAG: dihydropteroate synthase [Candidatus Odinarchaeia archaeon]